MANYSQRYNATTQTTTAGSFYFDTFGGVDYAVSKAAFGAAGAITLVSAADPLPVVAAATNTILGEVQASPTANTVLDRLKTINTTLSGTLTVGTHAVTQSGTWNVTNISGTVSLPTGASTLAEQQSQTTALNTLIGHVDGVEAGLTTANAFLDIMDDWDETNRCKVNLIVGQAGIAAGAGSVSASTPRVTLASDDPAVTALQLIDDAVQTHDGSAGAPAKVMVIGGFDLGNSEKIYALNCASDGTLYVNISSGTITAIGATAHDAAIVGSIPIQCGGYASAAAPTDVSADGDAVIAWHLRNGSQVCNLAVGGTLVTGSAGLPVAQQGTWNVGTVTTVTTCSTVTTLANGQTAHDSPVTGSPLRIGAKAETALSGITLVSDGDATDLHAGVDGVLITRPHCNLEDIVQERTTNTDGASTAFASGLAAPGAGVRLYITSITICNSSASFCTVDLRDGAAGSVLWTLPVPATGGVVQKFDPPLKLTANTALAFDASAATTTLTISGSGFKSKV